METAQRTESMADKQLLHLVIGGELKSLQGKPEFRDLAKVDLVGAFPNYQEALRAWRAKAQETVDNAHMRYFIIHAHRLLDPETGEEHTH
jgi:myo-inositol-1(or 4)-monophosphatase